MTMGMERTNNCKKCEKDQQITVSSMDQGPDLRRRRLKCLGNHAVELGDIAKHPMITSNSIKGTARLSKE